MVARFPTLMIKSVYAVTITSIFLSYSNKVCAQQKILQVKSLYQTKLLNRMVVNPNPTDVITTIHNGDQIVIYGVEDTLKKIWHEWAKAVYRGQNGFVKVSEFNLDPADREYFKNFHFGNYSTTVAGGKKLYNKRATIKKRYVERELKRYLK